MPLAQERCATYGGFKPVSRIPNAKHPDTEMPITRDHVQSAFDYIRDNGIAPNRASTKWDILDTLTQKRFPPKAVLRVAYELAGEEQPNVGGDCPTNDRLSELGFQIVLKPRLEESEVAANVRSIFESESDETTRERLISARLGQGAFRKGLLEIWHGQCAITGCRVMQFYGHRI